MSNDVGHDEVLGRVMQRLAALEAKNESLERDNRALEAEMRDLRDEVTPGSPNGRRLVLPRRRDDTAREGSDQGDGHVSRRGVFKLGGAALGGAALGVGASALGAGPAAADGPSVLLGNGGAGAGNNAGANQTSITAAPGAVASVNVLNTSSGGSGLYGQAGAASGLTVAGAVIGDTNSDSVDGVVGATSSGSGRAGVRGILRAPSAAGVGSHGGGAVVGDSKFGSGVIGTSDDTGIVAIGGVYGLAARGGYAPLLLEPNLQVHGAPTTGSHEIGEIFTDANGALFQCVGFGTPGTWVRVGFNPLNPTRILDTRNSSPIGPNSSINLGVGGHFGVPTQASAIVVNATVTRGTAQSFLTIYPEGITRPFASNLNWVAGQTIPNLVTVKLGTAKGITIYNSQGSVEVVLDLAGFYS
jgi:hypothetical protein